MALSYTKLKKFLLVESVQKDHKVLHAIAEDVLKQFERDPKALPMIDVNPDVKMSPFEYKLTPEKLEKIASKFDISSTFQSIIDYFKNEKRPDETILIVYFKDIITGGYGGQYMPYTTDLSYSSIILNITFVSYSSDDRSYKEDIVDFFENEEILEHELQHWYDDLRIKADEYSHRPYRTLYKAASERGLVYFADDLELYRMYREIPSEVWANASAALKRIYKKNPTDFLRDYYLNNKKELKKEATIFFQEVLDSHKGLLKDKSKTAGLQQRLIKLYFKVCQNRVEELSKDPFTKAIIDLLKKNHLILTLPSGKRYNLRVIPDLYDEDLKNSFFIKKGNVYKLKGDVNTKEILTKPLNTANTLLDLAYDLSRLALKSSDPETISASDYAIATLYQSHTESLANHPSIQSPLKDFIKALGIQEYEGEEQNNIDCWDHMQNKPMETCAFLTNFNSPATGVFSIYLTDNPDSIFAEEYDPTFGKPDNLNNLITYCQNAGLNVDEQRARKAFVKIAQVLKTIKKVFMKGFRNYWKKTF